MDIRWSIVITTRNRARMLERAIRSCVEQTVPCQIVVIDEASEDATAEIVKGVPNLKYMRHDQPWGHSAAANHGIRESDADWIKPLDDDDWLAPDCLEKMTAALTKAQSEGLNPVIISGPAVNVNEEGAEVARQRPVATVPVVLKSRDALELMLVDQAPLGTPVQVAHQRDAALKVGGWNEHRTFRHQQGDEVELWIKLAAQGDCVFIPSFIAYRTLWPGNTHHSVSPEDRFLSNVSLKNQISAELDRNTPEKVCSYLALHWALVASKNKMYGQAAKLGLRWLRHPSSVRLLVDRRSGKTAQKFMTPLERA
jgi:glycosyltransferase involved in cell wall biosynthesis